MSFVPTEDDINRVEEALKQQILKVDGVRSEVEDLIRQTVKHSLGDVDRKISETEKAQGQLATGINILQDTVKQVKEDLKRNVDESANRLDALEKSNRLLLRLAIAAIVIATASGAVIIFLLR